MRLQDTLVLEVRAAADGRFTLGSSKLGEDYIVSNSDLLNDTAFEWVDVTDGTLSMRITRGVNAFGGLAAIPEVSVGTLRVQTRNRILDPYTSPYMEVGKRVRLRTADNELVFKGRVANVSVDYRSEKQEPIISFDIVDPIASLQKGSTKLDGLTSVNKTWSQRINEIFNNAEIEDDIKISKEIVGGGSIKHSAWDSNFTVWEALTLAQTTEAGFIYFDRTNKMWAYGKGAFTPQINPFIKFSNIGPDKPNHDPQTIGYKDIVLDANSDSIINEIQVSNAEVENGNAIFEVLGPYRRQSSVNTYGAKIYSANTNFYRGSTGTDNTQVLAWKNDILDKCAQPQVIIREITWDGKKDVYSAALADIGDTINVEYVSEYTSLNQDLVIVGIEHEMNAYDDKWRVTYILFEQGRFS